MTLPSTGTSILTLSQPAGINLAKCFSVSVRLYVPGRSGINKQAKPGWSGGESSKIVWIVSNNYKERVVSENVSEIVSDIIKKGSSQTNTGSRSLTKDLKISAFCNDGLGSGPRPKEVYSLGHPFTHFYRLGPLAHFTLTMVGYVVVIDSAKYRYINLDS